MGTQQLKLALLLFIYSLLMVLQGSAQYAHEARHIEVSLRMIGHQVLLYSGDSTSRILPIIKHDDRYKISFVSEFEFYPEDLVTIINRVAKDTRLANHYIVEVEKCETGAIVYSYEMDHSAQANIIPCKSRIQPKSCYNLLFTLMDAESVLQTGFPDSYPNLSIDSNTQEDQANYSIIIIICALIVSTFLMLKKNIKRIKKNPNIIPLGSYLFDKQNAELLFGDKKIELTTKEADLLLLLHNTANATVERDVILNRVWGDKGDYVGRTLDVFISKLRKKLEADSSVKIVNIRGVGYKLVMDV